MMHVVNFLLQPERITGIATDPTGDFSRKYRVNPRALFRDSFAYATLKKNNPMELEVVLFAPKPSEIGFEGWKYEGWLVDQPPPEDFTSSTSAHPEFEGVPHPGLDGTEYPITTGLFRDTNLTLKNDNLNVFTNTFSIDQSAWPFDTVVVTFEPPETGTDAMNFDPRPDPVRPVAGVIPGRIPDN